MTSSEGLLAVPNRTSDRDRLERRLGSEEFKAFENELMLFEVMRRGKKLSRVITDFDPNFDNNVVRSALARNYDVNTGRATLRRKFDVNSMMAACEEWLK
jgi:hypothetical protein